MVVWGLTLVCCCCLTFGFTPSVSSALPPSLVSLSWFMTLFKWRPHVSPDAAICFSPASFFHPTPPSRATSNQQKLTPGSYVHNKVGFVAPLTRFAEAASGKLTGVHRDFVVVPTKRPGCSALLCRCCIWDVEKWHATGMPLIMLTRKVFLMWGKMADVTRSFYQPNFIRGFHVWAGKSGYFSSSFIL